MKNLRENAIERCCRIHRSACRSFVRHNPVGRLATLNEYSYQYDDIGNRLSSLDLGTNRTYTANSLNQYTNITGEVGVPPAQTEDFTPTFDLDGNQTLVKTATGIWSIAYNGENRPVIWSCGSTNITMKFDRMGRRVEYVETVNGVTNTHHRFVYDGYLCIQRLNAASNNAIDLVFGWDPSEPVATRPLVLQKYGQHSLFYTHDGNKNVSELVFFQQANGIAAHYEYAPFGAVIATSRSTSVTAYDFREYNPFRFSSEYADDTPGLVYYNYRHYEMIMGRWLSRDFLAGYADALPYLLCRNVAYDIDILGLISMPLAPMTPFSPICEIPPSPSVIDHLPWMNPNGEEEWFEGRYKGVLSAARQSFADAIASRINCEDDSLGSGDILPFEANGGLQPMFPPWASDPNSGDNITQYGDATQTSWERWASLGNFTINLENFSIVYDTCIDGRRTYHWRAVMYVSDGLGFNKEDGWPYWAFGTWLFPPRAARRAQWELSGEGECSCCENKEGK